MVPGTIDRHRISAEPLDPVAIPRSSADRRTARSTTFVGLVRDHNAGRRVLWLDYEAYAPLAVQSVRRGSPPKRADGGRGARWRFIIESGRVEIGEASVVIAAASAHRADAFAACRYAIERVKQIAPIWKHEHFEGGDVWIEGATADPEDEAARDAAVERACT